MESRWKSQLSCVPKEETYFSTFSSAVPVQLVPSIWQAFHDDMACVAARMSEMTSGFSGTVRWLGDAVVVGRGGSCACAGPSLWLGSGESRLKKSEALSNNCSDKIQSCQMMSFGTVGAMGWKGLNPRTRISWIKNREGKGVFISLLSRATALPWNCWR